MGALLPDNSDYFRWMEAVGKLALAYQADGMMWDDAYERALSEMRDADAGQRVEKN